MTTGFGAIAPNPYVVPDASLDDTDPSGTVLETTINTAFKTVDIGNGLMANAEVYNGAIPGPTFKLNVDDTVIVRLVNDLTHPTGIHWHGIELQNSADGTPVTQDPAAVGPFPQPVALSPAGGTYLYKFKVPRPGLYWYHPHHFHSTNRVFRGLYGMIVVADEPAESTLIGSGVLPGPADTMQLVLSDTTVCKAAGFNDPATYVDPTTLPAADAPEWLSGATAQLGPTPVSLCEIPPAGQAMKEDGNPAPASYAAGDIPNIQKNVAGRTVEGQTVLTNGVDVGGRPGTPLAPGTVPATAYQHPVQSGQGLRLQIVNCAHLRYFRLRLTTSTGAQVPLVRIGGEGGLLDNAVLEGGVISGFDTRYDSGEILLPPATRADVVAAIPAGEPAGSVLTLWTRDYQRTGGLNPGNWAQLPTVSVMHMNVTGAAPTTYAIVGGVPGGAAGTPLRTDPAVAAPVETLGPADGALLDPSGFSPAKKGMATGIELTAGGGAGINGIPGSFSGFMPYTNAPHLDSSRYAEPGKILQLTVGNASGAHHPFHLHGFSFQPLSLTPGPGAPAGSPTFSWTYREFRDTVDIPRNYVLTFRVRLDDRELADGVTLGGAFGRWLFHCHIFFHAHSGMISELVVTAADGSEKPNVDVGGSWAYTPTPGTATRKGIFSHPDGDLMTLTASKGTVSPVGPAAGGAWTWSYNSPAGDTAGTEYVYITAEDTDGRKDQAVFRLKVGAPDDGSDSGDPHIRTVDGKKYDLQSAGEFVLLRDRDGMEVQTRQTPVATQNPITDSYSGLTACVSVNTAVAARVGSHRVAYQPGVERGQLDFFVDGKRTRLTTDGIVLDGHRVRAFDADGATGLRIDYEHHPVVIVTPRFWTGHGVWYMNVSISHTQGDEGLMGPIPKGSWLPRLENGATVGPMPQSLHDRWVDLYQLFADSWRVTDQNSLFVYAPGTSTADFTDRAWPGESPPCPLKPEFELPGVPIPTGLPIAEAERICQGVTVDDLHRDCVFDVATTGDEVFAEGYLFAQDLRLNGTSVHIAADRPRSRGGEPVQITASVVPLSSGRPAPTGRVEFLANGAVIGAPVTLDGGGQARMTTDRLEVGSNQIRAVYVPGGTHARYHAGESLDLLHTVEESPVRPGGTGLDKWPLWVWLLFILILILIIGVLLFT